jgi:hypothetical protein
MFDGLINQDIIIETDSFFTYIGRLNEVGDEAVLLVAVTIYDERSARVPQERFLIEVAGFGNTASRDEIRVQRCRIIAVTPLAAVMLPPGAIE